MLAITGADGFIGKYISNRLPLPQKQLNSSKNNEYLICDNNQKTKVPFDNLNDSGFLKDVSTLLHLACKSYPRNSNQQLSTNVEEDLFFTTKIFEYYAKCNPEGHIIFASTGGNMYHPGSPYIPRNEKELPFPSSGYGVQKLASEHYLRLICQLHGIRATIFRISNPYGTLLSTHRPQGIIGVTLNKMLHDEPISIFDSLDSVRDYLHLEDLTIAFQIAIDHPPQPGNCELFNISSGMGYSLKQVLDSIEEVTNNPIKRINETPNEWIQPSWCVLSNELFKSQYDWKPQIDLNMGLSLMWNNIQTSRFSYV